MRTNGASKRRTTLIVSALASFALIAGACSNKKDEGATQVVDATDAAAGVVTTVAAEEPQATEPAAPDATDPPAVTEPPVTEPAAPEPVMGGRMVVAGEAEAANPWTPAAVQCDSFCQMRARTFYDPLVVVDNDLGWRPFLAESIEANADSSVFTIKIREGIKFIDDTDLNADAAMYNLNEAAKSLLVGAAFKDVAKDADKNFVMEKIDDYTFTIAMGLDGDPAKPLSWPLFPYYLGGQAGLMASPTWLDAVKAGTAQPDKPIGSGAFILDSYAPGDKMVVKKNPNYWVKDEAGNALPYLDEIEFRVIPDSQVASTAMRNGDIDQFSSSDSGTVMGSPDIGGFNGDEEFETILQDTYGETNYILLHLSKEGSPLKDTSIRCALYQAIDWADLSDVMYGAPVRIANGPFSPGQEGYLEDNGSLPFDADAATAAIEAYEAANGPIAINFSTTTSATNLARAQYLQDAWGAVGVDVTIDQIEQSKLINNALFGDPAFDAFGWRNHAGLFVDSQFFWWHKSAAIPDGGLALNFGRLDDPVINDLLEKRRTEADPAAATAIAEDINRQFAKECWLLPQNWTDWGVMHRQGIYGYGNFPQVDGKGGTVRDGAGFPGQVYMQTVFLSE